MRSTGPQLLLGALATVAAGLFTNAASEDTPHRWWWAAAAVGSTLVIGVVAAPGVHRLLFRRSPVDLHIALPHLLSADRGASWWALPVPLRPAELDEANRTAGPAGGAEWDHRLTRWVYERGGADIAQSVRRLTFQGVDRPVTIAGMRARVLDRTAVLSGTYVGVGLGGDEPPVRVDIDLDEDHPAAGFFADRVITIAPDENVVVDLVATANRSTVTWDLEIDFVAAGVRRTMTLRSGKHFLRTTGLRGTRVWHERPDGYSVNEHYGTAVMAGRDSLEYWSDEPAAG